MMQRDREFEQFLRRALHAAAESVVVREDGLERIRGRLAEVRRAAAADRAERLVPGPARILLAGGSLVDPGPWLSLAADGPAGNRLGDLRHGWQCGHQNVTRSSGSARPPTARAVRIAVPQRRHGRPGLP
jgi:hypothetical protein